MRIINISKCSFDYELVHFICVGPLVQHTMGRELTKRGKLDMIFIDSLPFFKISNGSQPPFGITNLGSKSTIFLKAKVIEYPVLPRTLLTKTAMMM